MCLEDMASPALTDNHLSMLIAWLGPAKTWAQTVLLIDDAFCQRSWQSCAGILPVNLLCLVRSTKIQQYTGLGLFIAQLVLDLILQHPTFQANSMHCTITSNFSVGGLTDTLNAGGNEFLEQVPQHRVQLVWML